MGEHQKSLASSEWQEVHRTESTRHCQEKVWKLSHLHGGQQDLVCCGYGLEVESDNPVETPLRNLNAVITDHWYV